MSLRDDVLRGLAQPQKSIPSKYLYDAEGSRLFDRITTLDAYYPTRTERAILTEHLDAIADEIGENAVLIEYGSGSSDKTRLLLDRLTADGALAAYVPIDISGEHLAETAARLRRAYPGLPVLPVDADYTRPFDLPELPAGSRRVVFFPGSTIGNFTADETRVFFEQAAGVAGPGGGLLIGADQRKDPAVLDRAYDDEEGVSVAFNLNLLARLNRELGADFDLDAWDHVAHWNPTASRMEMYLVSLREQRVCVAGRGVTFGAGETIHTEISTKYGPQDLADLALSAGWRRTHRWTDPRGWFAVEAFRQADGKAKRGAGAV